MGNHMKGCGCRRCRSGLHTKAGGKQVRKALQSARRATKQSLRRGEEPPPTNSIAYTD